MRNKDSSEIKQIPSVIPLHSYLPAGYGGTTKKHSEEDNAKVKTMVPVDWRPVTVTFTSTVNPGLDWEFTPVQNSVGYLIFYGSCYK